MGVNIEVLGKQLGIAAFSNRDSGQQPFNQLAQLSHQLMFIPTTAIPFKQGKFRIVADTRLATAKRFSQTEDIATTRGEQPFHKIFRRGLQVARYIRAAQTRATGKSSDTFYISVSNRCCRQHRHIDFKQVALLEKTAQLSQNQTALTQSVETNTGLPISHQRNPPLSSGVIYY